MLTYAAQAATVRVTVTGIRNANGHVLVAICPRAAFLQPHCQFQGGAPAQIGAVTVAIPNVTPGTYAAEAFHDENDNGRLDHNFFGLPTEGMGFSRDAPMHFGPPQFDGAAFDVGVKDLAISLRLRYF